MRRRLRLVANAVLRRNRFEREMADEMRFHVEARADDLVRAGLSRAEAERRARAEFGAIDAAREECRQVRGLRLLDELRQDLRYAARQMRKSPSFTLAAIVSLALGIGANAAIFSIADAVLYRRLPVDNPDALYFLGHRGTTPNGSISANYPLLERYRALDAFSGVTAYTRSSFPVVTHDGVEPVSGQFVSGNYHAVLGVPFAAGRGFSAEPDRPSGREPIAVISDAYWQRRFARSPDAIGQTLIVAGRPTTIVGVTAPGFHGLASGSRLDVTLPLWVKALDEPEWLDARDGWTSFTLVARRHDGVPKARAEAMVNAVFQRYWMEPENAWARRAGAPPRTGELLPAARGDERLRRTYGTPLLVLAGVVGIVLLIACGNVANLLLARAAARSREMAVRMSIGAGRARLIRQHLTESALLALLGGAAGLGVAALSIGAVLSLIRVGRNAVFLDVAIDARVLTVTMAISLAACVVFGLVPALRATRVDAAAVIAGGSSASRRLRLTTGKSLVVAQVALGALLVTLAGLLLGTMRNLLSVDAGFERANVALFNVETYEPSFTNDQRIAFYSSLVERLQSLPGVVSVSLAKRTPLDSGAERRRFSVPGIAPKEGQSGVSGNVVTPDYFQTFGVRILRGRGFTPDDRAGSQNVAIISEAAARGYFGDEDPLGRTVLLGGERLPVTIVGLAADVHHEELREGPAPMLYTPLAQPTEEFDGGFGYPGHMTAIVHAGAEPLSAIAPARQLVKALDARVPFSYPRTMEQQLDALLVRERLLARLTSAFGVLALVLAFVGLFALMSYSVARRTREIGIRMALGARRARVLRQVLWETGLLAGAGIVIGLGASVASAGVISSFLFGLTPSDPATLGAVAALFVGTALVAGFLPARRAARIEPVRTLRSE